EITIKRAKKALASSSQALESAVKGQFGTKITDVLEKQQQTLDKLSF
ncbi:MAG: hypothetical protein IC227_00005, partial [Enterococcus lacertideformus]|nr:hypothetical protein [Enterococcus lacertideformus]